MRRFPVNGNSFGGVLVRKIRYGSNPSCLVAAAVALCNIINKLMIINC